MVGTYRLIPEGSKIFSIHNQRFLITTLDTIIEITHTVSYSEDFVYGKPKQELLSGLLDLGQDEWGFNLLVTKEYEYMPLPLLDCSYENNDKL